MKKCIILTAVAGAATMVASASATEDIIYDNGAGQSLFTSSQLDTVYPFDSQVADDFVLSETTMITDVHWQGGYFNDAGDGSDHDVLGFRIMIYASTGLAGSETPTGGPLDPTGTALAMYEIDGNAGQTDDDGDGQYDYWVKLDEAFEAEAGTRYWLAIQAVVNFPPQWGWSQSVQQTGATAKQGFPLLGTDYWAGDVGADMAFQLSGVVPAPGALALFGLAAIGGRRRRA